MSAKCKRPTQVVIYTLENTYLLRSLTQQYNKLKNNLKNNVNCQLFFKLFFNNIKIKTKKLKYLILLVSSSDSNLVTVYYYL